MPCRAPALKRWRSPPTAVGARVVHVSAIGADENSSSLYGRSKAAGETLVLAAQPGAVIVRPSIMFGPEDTFFNRFAALARMAPALPLVGGGHTRFQPVFVGDVAEVIARAVDGDLKPGATYELGGPDVRSFKELMEYVLATIERRRLLVPVPFGLMKLQAAFVQLLPNPPITPDQVAMLRHDNVVSERRGEKRTLEGLGIEPTSFAQVVPSYLWRFRKTGQFRGPRLLRLANSHIPQRQRDQPNVTDDHAPPREHRKAVARDVIEERLHHDPGEDERDHEADGDQKNVAVAHLVRFL